MTALNVGVSQSDGVRTTGGISVGWGQLNRQQPKPPHVPLGDCKFLLAQALTLALGAILVVGCATTHIQTHVVGRGLPLCQTNSSSDSVLVLWGTAWRENQKEPTLREVIADRGIHRFFAQASCYQKVDILNAIAGRSTIVLSDTEALPWAATFNNGTYSKIVVLRVEELGPLLNIHLSPVLWDGATEVVFNVRVLTVSSTSLEVDASVQWKNGGAFVLRGLGSLEEDLQAALRFVFWGVIK